MAPRGGNRWGGARFLTGEGCGIFPPRAPSRSLDFALYRRVGWNTDPAQHWGRQESNVVALKFRGTSNED